jgi:hypothetical protein
MSEPKTKTQRGPLGGGDLMAAWRRAGMTDTQRAAEAKKAKEARLRELVAEALALEKELGGDDENNQR